MNLKQIFKSWLHPLVWERLGQAKQEYYWNKQIWHCDKALISIFERYLSYSSGYYVDVGANDGRSSSNTYHLEKYQDWTGVLIEPIMHTFFRSKQIRSLQKNIFFNCACVGPDFIDSNIELLYSGLMTILSSKTVEFDPISWAESGEQFLARGETVQKTWSTARTLDSILSEANSPNKIDLLSIDVEGSELGVLQGINFSKFLFKYILIETKIESASHKHLLDLEYKLVERIQQNLLFAHRSTLEMD